MAIFARVPSPRKAKTRLIPLLGAEVAASFQAALLCDALRKVEALPRGVARYLFLTGCDSRATALAPAGFVAVRQRGRDLGERLDAAFRLLLRRHARAIVIGTDSPELSAATLRRALRALRASDAVLGPCPDGGYYLIGFARRLPRLLRGVRWGGAFAFRDTLARLRARGLSCAVLEELEDVDRPRDFKRLAARLSRRAAGQARRRAPAVWRFLRERRKTNRTLDG